MRPGPSIAGQVTRGASCSRSMRRPCGSCDSLFSGEEIFHHMAVHIREAEVTAGVEVGEPFVVQPEAMEDGGLDVMDMDRVFHDVVTEFIGCAIGLAALDATAGHPDGEG